VIPARWASARFPGKVLASLSGRPLVLHACDIAARAQLVDDVRVAVDDERVARAVEDAGFHALRTSPEHASGTDRVAEAVQDLEADLVVGLQADEPFLHPTDLDVLVEALGESEEPARLATLAGPLETPAEWRDPNVVKVLVDGQGHAVYFSRAPIPYPRPASGPLPQNPPGPVPPPARRHVGVYGWRRESLLAFAALPASPLERAEGLEQLRALEAGWRIAVRPVTGRPFGVDRPEDLDRAAALWPEQPGPERNRTR
jgi:3-deoxy-manno-octulosonate cytidylyltransferase (CMP-KDO synthetase)